jgi:O-antigen/teichoic acid export membrane protein
MLNSEETLAQKFVKKWFWLYFFTLLIWPMGYIIKVITSNDLSVWWVGMIYGVISFVTLLAAFNDLGCTESLNFFLPKYIIKNEYGKAKYLLKLTLIMQLCSSILIASILFLIAPWLAEIYFNEPQIITILRIAGLYFIGINFFHITTVLFSVSQNTKLQKWSDFIKIFITWLGTFILLLAWQGTIESYMWAWISWVFIAFIFSLYFSYKDYYLVYFNWVKSEKDIVERNIFYKYAFATLLTANVGTLLSQVDMQMIIVQLWSEATGYYSNYLSLLNIPFIFISPLFGFLFPVISELHGRGDTMKMKMIHREFSLYFSIIWIWLSVFLFQFGEPLAMLFFWEKFKLSWVILGYSAFFLTFLLLVQINFQFLAGTWKIGERARILSIVLPINILLNYILIRMFGVEWSALAVWISWIPLWYLSFRATKQHNSGFDWVTLTKNIGYVAITGMILYLFIWQLPINETTRLWSFLILIIAMAVNLIIFGIGNISLLKNAWHIIRTNR